MQNNQNIINGFDFGSLQINIYQECEKTNKNLRKVFTSEQLQQMQIALEDY